MDKKSPQKIAVVGSGISGLTAAFLLSQKHNVSVFESNDYIGGHTHTVRVCMDQGRGEQTYEVDTGFIVCNDRNYPNFLNLLEHLGVALKRTEMSFSVNNPQQNLEYNGHNLDTLFAQRSNILSPRFIRFVRDILRFNKAAKARFAASDSQEITLDSFLTELKLSPMLRDNYLLPMVAAIWSCSVRQAGEFPLDFFLRFFLNHGLLDVKNRPQWYVLEGGSHSYIEPLTAPYSDSMNLNTRVTGVERVQNGIRVYLEDGPRQFDHIVMACHSDEALALLRNPSKPEQSILSNLQYQENAVTLHWDDSLMPIRKKAWASWNFLTAPSDSNSLPIVTYCMNVLQGIGSILDPRPLLVSLNADHLISPDKVIDRFRYAHPIYSLSSSAAQRRRAEICGIDRIHYCGAYWYNGFHEDGVRSALDVCNRFGIKLQ